MPHFILAFSIQQISSISGALTPPSRSKRLPISIVFPDFTGHGRELPPQRLIKIIDPYSEAYANNNGHVHERSPLVLERRTKDKRCGWHYSY
jgi:hypothetical protein